MNCVVPQSIICKFPTTLPVCIDGTARYALRLERSAILILGGQYIACTHNYIEHFATVLIQIHK